MKINVYYRASDGEINGYDTSPIPSVRVGLEVVAVETDIMPDRKIHKFDTSTFVLRNKTPEEIAASNMPTRREVDQEIYLALRNSDVYMIEDYPITAQQKLEWKAYRQTLRDLSKIDSPTPTNMINNWPIQPDGNDAIADFRRRQP